MIREDVVIEPLPEQTDWRELGARALLQIRTTIVQARKRRAWAAPAIAAGLAEATGAIYATGGTSHGFTLRYLLPILAGGYFAGPLGGGLTGFAAATIANLLPGAG